MSRQKVMKEREELFRDSLEFKSMLENISDLTRVIPTDLSLLPDPMIDIKRLKLLTTDTYESIESTVKTVLAAGQSGSKVEGLYESAKKMDLAHELIKNADDKLYVKDYINAMLGSGEPTKAQLKSLSSMSKETFKALIGFAGTRRMRANMKYWKHALSDSNRIKLLNTAEYFDELLVELDSALDLDIKSQFTSKPDDDPMTDIFTLRLRSNASHVLIGSAINPILADGKSGLTEDKFESAMNMALAFWLIKNGTDVGLVDDYISAIGVEGQPSELQLESLSSMSKKMFTRFVGYAGTPRIRANMKFWKNFVNERPSDLDISPTAFLNMMKR